MWKIDLNELEKLYEDSSYPTQWEQIAYRGKTPGLISHHTCTVIGEKMILFGGLKGDKQNLESYTFDIASNNWDIIKDLVSYSTFELTMLIG